MDVIHKLVLPGADQFEVPVESTLVSVGVDPAGKGPAVWFRRPADGLRPQRPTKTWSLGFVGTGDPFPSTAIVLGTVLTGPFAFHVLDLEGNVTR